MGRRSKYEEAKHYIEVESDSGCKLLSDRYGYKDNTSRLSIKCKCGEVFTPTLKSFKYADVRQCKQCKANLTKKLPKWEKTPEGFVKRILSLVGDEYTPVSKYVRYHSPVKMRHNKCGYEWDVRPANFISGGTRCPKCAKNLQGDTEDFKSRVYKMYKDEYKVMGEYVNNHTKIKLLHTKCGKTNMIRPNDVLRGNKCHYCSGRKRKTIEQIQEELYEIVGDEYSVEGEYKNNRSPLTFTHNRCKAQFKMNSNNFIDGEQRCPICAMSKGEQVVYKYLTDNNIKFTPQKFYVGLKGVNDGLLSYDFHLPKYRTLIEYQGIQHRFYRKGFHESEESFNIQLEHDKRKKEYAQKHNIKLLEIWYDDFDNIESILNQELGIS